MVYSSSSSRFLPIISPARHSLLRPQTLASRAWGDQPGPSLCIQFVSAVTISHIHLRLRLRCRSVHQKSTVSSAPADRPRAPESISQPLTQVLEKAGVLDSGSGSGAMGAMKLGPK